MATAKCSSCGAEIIWTKTEAGNNMPLDAAKTENGSWDIQDGVAVYVGRERNGPYQTHWATCPNAKSHRKPRKPA